VDPLNVFILYCLVFLGCTIAVGAWQDRRERQRIGKLVRHRFMQDSLLQMFSQVKVQCLTVDLFTFLADYFREQTFDAAGLKWRINNEDQNRGRIVCDIQIDEVDEVDVDIPITGVSIGRHNTEILAASARTTKSVVTQRYASIAIQLFDSVPGEVECKMGWEFRCPEKSRDLMLPTSLWRVCEHLFRALTAQFEIPVFEGKQFDDLVRMAYNACEVEKAAGRPFPTWLPLLAGGVVASVVLIVIGLNSHLSPIKTEKAAVPDAQPGQEDGEHSGRPGLGQTAKEAKVDSNSEGRTGPNESDAITSGGKDLALQTPQSVTPSNSPAEVDANGGSNEATPAATDPHDSTMLIDDLILTQIQNKAEEVDRKISEISRSAHSRPEDSDEANRLNKEGLKELKAKNYPEAASAFKAASQAGPSDAKLFSNLGYAEMYSGDLQSARSHLNQSLVLDPTRPVAWGDLGAMPLL